MGKGTETKSLNMATRGVEVLPGPERSGEEEWEQVDEKMPQLLLTEGYFETPGPAVTKPKPDPFAPG